MSNKTGGRAFPNPAYSDVHGMTLRDYFAAKAMQSFVKTIGRYHDEKSIDGLAQTSYWVADAMLRARGETE